jgi:hypothetical protein
MCKDGKGSSIRINLGIAAARRCTFASRILGFPHFGGNKAPAGRGYTKIYSTDSAFAALKANGSIKVWGNPNSGGKKAPSGRGYTKIYSTSSAFAALKANGLIKVWGDQDSGGNKSWYNLYQRVLCCLQNVGTPTP